ncbi:DUF2817 domain-containing protein [Spongiibacter taiwanensis]|uniref:DUF2817 domain-containing protein n=1 Tax=Spongiibacter taiwanensis TaxID=1748242 RepID=UPI002034E7BD|nr:DUF2817 domain-containing protein [Spongiibacter taiwanensis]USA43841.1 DUF2817 domain-containing protein [Spongiibacter taiwanensis]
MSVDADTAFGPELPSFTEVMDLCRGRLHRRLPELLATEQLYRVSRDLLVARNEATVPFEDMELPIVSLTLGNPARARHCLVVTGGIHGVERIGTQVLLAWLESVLERCRWDKHWRAQFEDQIAIVAMPLINPVGMIRGWRSNGNCVDLNRHAPIDAEDKVPFLVGGQRIWRKLPWYRGRRDGPWEAEFIGLENVVRRCTKPDSMCLAVDFHSGFGFQDHLWIPYAYRRSPIESIADYVSLKLLWERNFPNHNYAFGPQALHYLSHGDIWDYLYIKTRKEGLQLLPLTLEMGSWLWVKKRPRQLFSFAGLFNPTVPHRHARVLRSHLVLLDFLLSAARNYHQWRSEGDHQREMQQMAQSLWYRQF